MRKELPDFSNLTCWLIGHGAWGKNIARTLADLNVGYIRTGGDSQPLDLGAVFIATPLATHTKLVLPFIEQGIPVFVEKPLAHTRAEVLSLVRAWWGSPKAPFLCDFQHLFSGGFEAVMKEYAVQKPSRVSIAATLGGPGPVRADCHPVWDYGSHLVAMAVQLGLKDDLLRSRLLCDGSAWTIEGPSNSPHSIELAVSNVFTERTRRMTIAFDNEVVGFMSGDEWTVGGYRFSNVQEPPLSCAMEAFLTAVNATKTVLGPAHDSRFGLSLPLDVDAVLRRLIEP